MFELQIDGQVFVFEDEDRNLPHWQEMRDSHDHVVGFKNEFMGMAVVYCKSPAGSYNQVVFYNRGGSVIVPTVEHNGELYFLALVQKRPLVQEDPIFEFPRGQALLGEKSVDTARRELLEESGLQVDEGDLIHLGRANPDSALVMGANVHAWWLRLSAAHVQEGRYGQPQLRPDFVANPESKLAENIRKAVLVPAEEFDSESMMTDWAAGKIYKRLWLESRSR